MIRRKISKKELIEYRMRNGFSGADVYREKKRLKNEERKRRREERKNGKYFLEKESDKSERHPTVYLILMWYKKEKFLKVGMTRKTLKGRFRDVPYKWKVIHSVNVADNLLYAYEQAIHGLCKDLKHIPSMHFTGYTECYCMDAKNKILSIIG